MNCSLLLIQLGIVFMAHHVKSMGAFTAGDSRLISIFCMHF